MPRNTPNLNLFVPDPGQSGIAAQLNSNYDAIDGTMDPVGGHKHTGAPGAAPKIAVANIDATGTPDSTTYLRGDGQWAAASSGTSGVTDHGALTGLADDDHPQYATQARGDARYLQLANNLSDVTNAAAARTALDAAQTAHVHAAADVTSGVMASARLGAGAASSSTYLRGDGQWAAVPDTGGGGMTNPMTAAGDLIVGGASGTPARLGKGTALQVLRVNAGGTALEYATAGGVLLSPHAATHVTGGTDAIAVATTSVGGLMSATDKAKLDDISGANTATTSRVTEDFDAGSATTNNIGRYGWNFSSGTVALKDSEANHPGIITRATTATSGQTAALSIGSGQLTLASEVFQQIWVVRPLASDANTTLRVGLANGWNTAGAAPPYGVYFEKLDADTNWFVLCRQASVSSARQPTGVSATAPSWVALILRRVDASTIGFRIGATIALALAATELLVTTQIPTAGLTSGLHVINSAAAIKALDVDLMDLEITGLSR